MTSFKFRLHLVTLLTSWWAFQNPAIVHAHYPFSKSKFQTHFWQFIVLSTTDQYPYVDVPAEPRKCDFLYTNFRPITHLSVYLEKHLILHKLGAFYKINAQNPPNFWIWAPSSLMKTHRSLYKILRKAIGRHIYVSPPSVAYEKRSKPWIFLSLFQAWPVSIAVPLRWIPHYHVNAMNYVLAAMIAVPINTFAAQVCLKIDTFYTFKKVLQSSWLW